MEGSKNVAFLIEVSVDLQHFFGTVERDISAISGSSNSKIILHSQMGKELEWNILNHQPFNLEMVNPFILFPPVLKVFHD